MTPAGPVRFPPQVAANEEDKGEGTMRSVCREPLRTRRATRWRSVTTERPRPGGLNASGTVSRWDAWPPCSAEAVPHRGPLEGTRRGLEHDCYSIEQMGGPPASLLGGRCPHTSNLGLEPSGVSHGSRARVIAHFGDSELPMGHGHLLLLTAHPDAQRSLDHIAVQGKPAH